MMNVMSKKNLIVWINDDRTTSNFYWVFLNFQTVAKKKWFLTFNSPNSFLKLSYFIFQIFWTAFIEVSFIFFSQADLEDIAFSLSFDPDFFADHPFFYYIYDINNKTTIFSGQISANTKIKNVKKNASQN